MATSIQHCTGSFSQSNWVKKVGNKVVKVYFLDDMILYIENSIEQKSIITNNSVKLQKTKLIYRHLWHFYTLIKKYQKSREKSRT